MIDENLLLRADQLERFNSLLNYELSTSLSYLIQFYWDYAFILGALPSVLFIPYLLYILVKEKKYIWILLFVLLVLLPLLTIILFLSDSLFYLAAIHIPLSLNYLYCLGLRFDAIEWLKEINAKIEFEQQKTEPQISEDYSTLR